MTTARTILTAALLLASVGPGALAQPDSNVGPGERRLNEFVFKAAHNSYERSEPMNQQIQTYSTYFLELDMFWDDGPGTIMVEHFCQSAHNARTLLEELQEIALPTAGQDDRVVVVYLEMKEADGPCYQDWPSRDLYRLLITNMLSQTLGLDNIYPADEFKNLDQYHWPSMQELNRRGYRYIVILDEIVRADSDLFFGVTTDSTPSGVRPNTVLINQDNGADDGRRNAFRDTIGPGWLNRVYSDRDLCSLNDGAYWNDSVARGFNYIGTNCVNDPDTITDTRIHSPSPLFVIPSFPGTASWGTWDDPMTSMTAAASRVSAGVTISAFTGTYDVPNATTWSNSFTIKARGGPVTIR